MNRTKNTFFDWLGPESSFGCIQTGQAVFTALGVTNNVGYKAINHADHCGFPAAMQPQLTAFFNKFLLKTPADTTIFTTDGNFTFDKSEWVSWTTPKLH